MRSLHAGTYWDIPVKIHWTFSLLFMIILGIGWYNGADGMALLAYGLFIILMFVCVILHEYGHALAARKYGVKTLDIIISPIGGIARLQKLPEKPSQELIIAIAGPLVNLVIAVLLFLCSLLLFTGEDIVLPDESIELISTPYGFLALLFWINCVLFVFNLVPAFPMDGGRILRAFLSMKYGKVNGTKYASIVGRVLAVIFVLYGVMMSYYTLIFIGIFVYMMARAENRQVLMTSKLAGKRVSDIMNVHYTKFHLSSTMREVFDRYVRGGERNYLVYDSMENLSGVLLEAQIKDADRNNDLDRTANEMMTQNFHFISADLPIHKLLEEMNVKGVIFAIVKNDDQILGVIDRQMLYTFVQLQMVK